MLADEIARALPELRAQAESMMATPCQIDYDAAPADATDPETGAAVHDWQAVYSGRCKVTAGTQSQREESAGASATVSPVVVKVPAETSGVRIGDRVTTPGHVYTVTEVRTKTWQVSLELACEELT